MSSRIPASAREIATRLAREGWTFTGKTRGGHLIFVHPSGARTTTSSTPSHRSAHRDAVARARREVRKAQMP